MKTRRFSYRTSAASSEEELLTEINITPLTDVLLVLLIIFLLAAAAGVFGLNVRLPKGTPKAFQQNRFHGIMVTIPAWGAAKHAVFVDSHLIRLEILPNYLLQEKKKKQTDEIVLRIDRAVPYGTVVAVLDAAKLADLKHFSFAAPVVNQ